MSIIKIITAKENILLIIFKWTNEELWLKILCSRNRCSSYWPYHKLAIFLTQHLETLKHENREITGRFSLASGIFQSKNSITLEKGVIMIFIIEERRGMQRVPHELNQSWFKHFDERAAWCEVIKSVDTLRHSYIINTVWVQWKVFNNY